MKLTELQALSKTCFMTIPKRGEECPSGLLRSLNCLGSGCMAWRWADHDAASDRQGYCGLAGRPWGVLE